MNIYKHSAVTFTASALLLIIFKNFQIAISCFITGIFIDLDHIIDYLFNRGMLDIIKYLRHPKKLIRFISYGYTKYKPFCKVYKPLHSIELLIPAIILYIFGFWNDILTGAVIGFLIHLVMDTMVIGHIGAVSLIYKILYRFPKGSDIIKKRLTKIGKNPNFCQLCGCEGDTIIYNRKGKYTRFSRKKLYETMILCSKCYEQINGE